MQDMHGAPVVEASCTAAFPCGALGWLAAGLSCGDSRDIGVFCLVCLALIGCHGDTRTHSWRVTSAHGRPQSVDALVTVPRSYVQ